MIYRPVNHLRIERVSELGLLKSPAIQFPVAVLMAWEFESHSQPIWSYRFPHCPTFPIQTGCILNAYSQGLGKTSGNALIWFPMTRGASSHSV